MRNLKRNGNTLMILYIISYFLIKKIKKQHKSISQTNKINNLNNNQKI